MTASTGSWSDVSVVIVTYNSAAVIEPCLRSVHLAKQVIVVDNASTDRTLAVVAETLPKARIIGNDRNRGFGFAVNQGMAVVETRYGFCFSPDAVLAEDAMTQLLAAAAAYPEAGMVGPYLQRPDGKQELYVMGPSEINHTEMTEQPDGDFCTWFVMGGFFLASMSAWRQIGGFDERIFLYNEDADLSLRTTAAGFSLVLAPMANVVHVGGRSSKVTWRTRWRKDWHQTWSRLYHEAKHGDIAVANCEAQRILLKHATKTALYTVLLRPDRVRGNLAKAMAAFAFLAGKPAQ